MLAESNTALGWRLEAADDDDDDDDDGEVAWVVGATEMRV